MLTEISHRDFKPNRAREMGKVRRGLGEICGLFLSGKVERKGQLFILPLLS